MNISDEMHQRFFAAYKQRDGRKKFVAFKVAMENFADMVVPTYLGDPPQDIIDEARTNGLSSRDVAMNRYAAIYGWNEAGRIFEAVDSVAPVS